MKEEKIESWFKIKLFYSLPKKFKVRVNKLWDEYFRSRKTKRRLVEIEDKFCSTPFAYLLALENNSIIGVNALYKRKINYGKIQIMLGGFGGVCTVKKKRGKGVATALLKKGMKRLKLQKCDMAYLCTNAKKQSTVGLYKKAGFIVLNKPYAYLGKSGKRYTEKNGMIAPIRSKHKFSLIMKSKRNFDIGIGNW